MKIFSKIIAMILLVAVLFPACKSSDKTDEKKTVDYLNESREDFDRRMEWWRDAGFGMFIHWGIYSVPAGIYNGEAKYAEWIMNQAKIPVEEYEKYALEFDPVGFDADEWVRMARDAGMKYIVITSKHHDGFCMWDSKLTDYDIVDATPFKRDVLKELADACEKQGMVLCFYHSIMDWHHPDAKGDRFPKYREEYLKPQLKELLTNYGKIGVMWFDGEWTREWTEEQGRDLYSYVRSLQPDIIINNRVGKGRAGMRGMNKDDKAVGDFGTPEQEILESSASMDWESCMTMNNHWGYASYDKQFKPTKLLVYNIVDIAAKGGNYLLNIGPTSEGVFLDESIERLEEIGAWMKINGEVVHNSGSLKNYQENDSLYYVKSKDGKWLYAIATEWPGESLVIRYVQPLAGSGIELLGYDGSLDWRETVDGGTEIVIPASLQKPEQRPCRYAWVFKMKGREIPVAEMPEILVGKAGTKNKVLFTDQLEVSISTSTPGAIIYYTLSGEEPDDHSMRYSGPIVVSGSTVIRAVAGKDGYIKSSIASTDFQKITTVKTVTLKIPPDEEYDANGPLTLVNGVLGKMDYKAGEWLGWKGNDMEAIVDFGGARDLKEIRARFLQVEDRRIFLPQYVEFYVSGDGRRYEKAGRIDNDVSPVEKGRFSKTFSAPVTGKYRYVKVFAKNLGTCPGGHAGAGDKAWLFSDEIIMK